MAMPATDEEDKKLHFSASVISNINIEQIMLILAMSLLLFWLLSNIIEYGNFKHGKAINVNYVFLCILKSSFLPNGTTSHQRNFALHQNIKLFMYLNKNICLGCWRVLWDRKNSGSASNVFWSATSTATPSPTTCGRSWRACPARASTSRASWTRGRDRWVIQSSM